MTDEEFKSLILPRQDMMYRVAFLILRKEEDAADIVQETMLSLWQKRASLSSDGNIQAYCAAATRNKSLSHIRDTGNVVSLEDTTVEPAEEPSVRFESKERLSAVESMLERLPENQKRVIRLFSYSGCSNEEIAEITGFSDVNVRALLSRGRRRLRELLSSSAKH